MKLKVLSQYKNGSGKPDLEISLTVDINTTIYDLRTQINKFLGVKAYYQLISIDNRIMLNNFLLKEYCNNDINHIFRLVKSEETAIDVSSSDEECNSGGIEFVKYVEKEEEKAVNRAEFIKSTIRVKDDNSAKKINLDESENEYSDQIKILRSMGYLDDITNSNVLKLTEGNIELAINYLALN